MLTYDVDEENGTIAVAMAGNYPLPQSDPLCTWYDILYVGFRINPEADEGNCNYLCIDHAMFNEGEPVACTDDGVFTVIRHAIAGNVVLCSTGVALHDVLMTLTWDRDMDGAIDSVWATNTDENGDYWFYHLYGSTGEYYVTPSKEGDLGIQTITSFDASLILRTLCGGVSLDSCQLKAADVTGDGTVSAFDASVLLKYVVTQSPSAPFAPQHRIGTWLFFPPVRCTVSIKDDVTNQDFYGILVGDVSKNWPGPPSPKIVAGGMDVEVGPNKLLLNFDEPVSSTDITLENIADLEPVDVKIEDGMAEWLDNGYELRITAASDNVFSKVTITFTELSHVLLDISALVNEGMILSTTAEIVPLPRKFVLHQNSPNPFNPKTSIQYTLPGGKRRTEDGGRITPSHVSLKIYNILGQEVRVLVDEVKEAGYYTVTWDGKDASGNDVTSGVYFYRLDAGGFSSTKRMMLMK